MLETKSYRTPTACAVPHWSTGWGQLQLNIATEAFLWKEELFPFPGSLTEAAQHSETQQNKDQVKRSYPSIRIKHKSHDSFKVQTEVILMSTLQASLKKEGEDLIFIPVGLLSTIFC